MPIQVNEIIIKAVIQDESAKKKKTPKNGKDDKEEIISECVEQVLKIIKEKTER
jgi:hypothetical protein